ncbi:MAG: glycosyltransferase [Flavobacteriales bacterium]|nr:glycosyltransferase [Flavobacteriales bacterium]
MSKSSKNKLHLVAFNIPFPADNGGLIDIFCKIKALKEAGVSIILHCYEYGRPQAPELNAYCEEVHYYRRDTGKNGLFGALPYVVYGRRSEELVNRLAKDNYPILLEGLHCCGIISNPQLKKRKIFVRTHNVEHDYYRGLANVERNIFKRYYYSSEAGKLEQFEQILAQCSGIFAISKADAEYFSKKYADTPVWCVTAFHLNDKVSIDEGGNDFALYHGSLDVAENNHAAIKLVKEVFNDLPYKLVIAGKNPSKELRDACDASSNVCLKSKVDTAEIQSLVHKAHINILPTWQSTGIKLKLLMALFYGRHCLVNENMVKGTGLEKLCRIENTPQTMKKGISDLFSKKFTQEEIAKRSEMLETAFSNRHGAEIMLKEIFPSR